MLTKRVIPCLDVKDGRVVKGVNFVGLRDAGDPVELARFYDAEGADEVIFLDITATSDKRTTTIEMASEAARQLSIPYAVGGGFRDVAGMRTMVAAGADKVSLNSAAVADPSLIGAAAAAFGSQAVVCAIDAKRVGVPGAPGADRWEVFVAGGRKATGIDAVWWAQECARRVRYRADARRVPCGPYPGHCVGGRRVFGTFRRRRHRRGGRCRARCKRVSFRNVYGQAGEGVHGVAGDSRSPRLLMRTHSPWRLE